jgi:hypothetical protein
MLVELTVAAFLELTAVLPTIAADSRKPGVDASKQFDWNRFVDKLEQFAEVSRSPDWEQLTYANTIATLLGGVQFASRMFAEAPSPASQGRVGPDFKSLKLTTTFEIDLITFDKGDGIQAHDHPNMTAVMTPVDGELQVQNYEIAQPASGEDGSILLRKVASTHLQRRAVSALTAQRGNIHVVRAQTSCHVIDIFTPPYTRDTKIKTRWFDIDPVPVDASGNVYRAYCTSCFH